MFFSFLFIYVSIRLKSFFLLWMGALCTRSYAWFGELGASPVLVGMGLGWRLPGVWGWAFPGMNGPLGCAFDLIWSVLCIETLTWRCGPRANQHHTGAIHRQRLLGAARLKPPQRCSGRRLPSPLQRSTCSAPWWPDSGRRGLEENALCVSVN